MEFDRFLLNRVHKARLVFLPAESEKFLAKSTHYSERCGGC